MWTFKILSQRSFLLFGKIRTGHVFIFTCKIHIWLQTSEFFSFLFLISSLSVFISRKYYPTFYFIFSTPWVWTNTLPLPVPLREMGSHLNPEKSQDTWSIFHCEPSSDRSNRVTWRRQFNLLCQELKDCHRCQQKTSFGNMGKSLPKQNMSPAPLTSLAWFKDEMRFRVKELCKF